MFNSQNNPFVDMFKQFTNQDQMTGWFKNFMTNDMTSFASNMQKNSETMVKAGQVNVENMQAIFRRAGEVMQNNLTEAVATTRDLMSSHNPEHIVQRQQQYIRDCSSAAMNNSKELVEMMAKSAIEVYDIFNKRFSENVHEAASQTVKKK